MSLIEQELVKYIGLEQNELDGFMFLLKEKGFLEPDNSLQSLLKMFETAYGKGRRDLYEELSEAMEEDIINEEE